MLFDTFRNVWPEIASVVFHWEVWFFVCIGVAIGVTVGAIPGMTGSMGVALLLPFCFYLSATNALVMLIGLYKGSMFGGSITAICFATPGMPGAAADVADGYALTKQGKSRKAIEIALYASVIADTLSDFVLIGLVMPLAMVAVAMGPTEMLALFFFALILIVGFVKQSFVKGLISVLVGFLIASIGTDPLSGALRLTFGINALAGGVDVVAFVIGIYAFSEIFYQLNKAYKDKSLTDNEKKIRAKKNQIHLKEQEHLTFRELLSCWKEIMTGFVVGTFLGALPGPGSSLAAFSSHSIAGRFAKDDEAKALYGHGAIQGLAAAEAGNSATSGATFIPLFAFGIPGSALAGIFLGAFMMQGITPGPAMFDRNPEVIFTILLVMVIANVFNLVIGKSLSGVFSKLAYVPAPTLFTFLAVLATLGVYAVEISVSSAVIVTVLGIVGYAFRAYDYPLEPMLIGFFVATAIEKYLRRALLISRGNIMFLFQSPIAIMFYALAVVVFIVLTFGNPWKLLKKNL